MQIGRWEILDRIADGPWSTVALAKPVEYQGQNADYVIKYANADSPEFDYSIKMLTRELACSKLVSHPSIISFLDSDLDDPLPYLVSARQLGETFANIIAKVKYFVDLGEKLSCFRQTCDAVATLHRSRIRHGDLSPANIILNLDDVELMIVDLGLSEQVNEFKRSSEGIAGTPGYVAPECVNGQQPVGLSADIYSIGIMMFEFFSFDKFRNPNGNPKFSSIQSEILLLIDRMKSKNPLRRPTIAEVQQEVSWLEIRYLDLDYQAAA